MAAPATKSEILDVNRRYHDVAADEYDAKWGISFAEIGQEQVVGKLAKLLGAAPGPVRALAGDRRRHGLLQPQHAAGGRRRRGDLHRHLARACSPRSRRNARAARPRRGDRRLRRRRAAVRGRELRPRLRPRRAAPPARARALVRRVPSRAAARAGRCSSPASPRATGDRIAARAQARRVAHLARRGARRCGVPKAPHLQRPPDGRRRRPPPRGRRSTCTRSSPATSSATPPAAGFDARARARRRAAGQLVRLVQPHAGGQRGPEGDPECRGSITRTAAICCCLLSTSASARGPPPAAALLQLDARRDKARIGLSRDRRARAGGAIPGRSCRPARSTCSATAARSWTPASGPSAFVTVNAIAGLETAAAVAVGIQLVIAIERLIRRRPVTNAIGGLLGTGLAVFIALRSGSAEGYFVPRMIYAARARARVAGSGRGPPPARRHHHRALYRAAVRADQRQPRAAGVR